MENGLGGIRMDRKKKKEFKSVFENCDGYLWVKPLGESDGKENGSPKAGRFYLEYALKVIENSKKIGTFNFQ